MDSRRAPAIALLAGAAALVVAAEFARAAGTVSKALPWLGTNAMFLAVAAVVWRRRPSHPMAGWFAAVAAVFALTQVFDGLVPRVAGRPDADAWLPWVALVHQWSVVLGSVVAAHFLGLFPEGWARGAGERRALRSLWLLLALPAILLVARPTLLFPAYLQLFDVPNGLHVPVLRSLAPVAAVSVTLTQGAFVVGVVLLVRRYRRAPEDVRLQIRWLVFPALLAAFAVVADLLAWTLYPESGPSSPVKLAGGLTWVAALGSLPLAIAVALLRPRLLDVDAVLRRSLVYGVVWTLIAVGYVGAAAGLGVAAGQRFPVEAAIALAVAATVAFQPARRRIERVADRWVFGERLGRYEALRHLGQTLEEGFDLADLLPRLADTVQRGLGLSWVRVVLEGGEATDLEATAGDVPADEVAPSVLVPVVDAHETVGRIECGVATGRTLADEDHELLTALARQAGLAMRTLRLTRALSESVEILARRSTELEESRGRLVRVQEAERRRLERDLHDGVQQEIVALIGRVGLARRHLERDAEDEGQILAEVQTELGRILSIVREFGRGIHPTVLTDRGLVEAVEAQAARSPLPVTVVADDALRTERFPEDVESAAYLTVCEALANVLKHAAAGSAEVRLGRDNGALRVAIADAGRGFELATVENGGLRNLAERVEALGGRLTVTSGPGRGTTVTAELVVADEGVLRV